MFFLNPLDQGKGTFLEHINTQVFVTRNRKRVDTESPFIYSRLSWQHATL